MTLAWQPSASLLNLRLRAQLLQQIRAFFAEREVMEVETPLLCHTSVPDPYIESIPALFQAHPKAKAQYYYLQTSPEYAMKRLLAYGSGPIYQLGKAFRQGEIGSIHNPEFTMLEWYRPGFDHHQLMDEVDALLQLILKTDAAERITYTAVFQHCLNLHPEEASLDTLAACASQHGIHLSEAVIDRDTWLQLLMSHAIEPRIGLTRPCFIYDFPSSQAALARLQATTPPLASRFEVYYQGIELANGFHELQSATEQRARFDNNLRAREALGLAPLPLDELFLAALAAGLPDCSGVAMGIDRLVMLALELSSISEVLSFDFTKA